MSGGVEVMDWLLKGGLVLLGGGLAWVVKEMRSMRKEARDSAETVTEAVWKRAKDTMAEDRARIHSLEKANDTLADERDKERDDCTRRVEEVRRDLKDQMAKERQGWQDDFDRLSGKYREVLKICADQEEEIQHSRIVIAKINQRRSDPMPTPPPATLIGGRRPYDPPDGSAATVTVTVPAARPGQPDPVSVVREPSKP